MSRTKSRLRKISWRHKIPWGTILRFLGTWIQVCGWLLMVVSAFMTEHDRQAIWQFGITLAVLGISLQVDWVEHDQISDRETYTKILWAVLGRINSRP